MGYEEKVEYVRTIVVARLLWSQWYARLPGDAHIEELCEAPLTRGVHLTARHPHNCTFGEVHDLFMLSLIAGQSPRNLQNVNVPKRLPHLVECRVKRLMQRCDVGVIPPLFWSSQNTSVVHAEWNPTRMDFPCSPDAILHAEHYRGLCTNTLQTLVKPVTVDPHVMAEL